MIGSSFALLTAIFFSFNGIFIRRAVLKVPDASLGTLISVPMAIPFFFLLLVFSGDMRSLLSFSWQSYFWLSLAGINIFAVGSSLYYQCAQLVGANIANILSRVSTLISVVIGITVLHEPLSWQLAIGVLLITGGITLAGWSPRAFHNAHGQILKIPTKAYVLGFGNGVAWGLGPIFIKLGLKGSGSPLAGALITYLAATAALSISLMSLRRRTSTAHISGHAAGLFFIAGLFSFAANLTRFVALSLAPASVVAPLVATAPIFLLVFSFLFNRKLEVFSMPVIIGAVTVFIGGILII